MRLRPGVERRGREGGGRAAAVQAFAARVRHERGDHVGRVSGAFGTLPVSPSWCERFPLREETREALGALLVLVAYNSPSRPQFLFPGRLPVIARRT